MTSRDAGDVEVDPGAPTTGPPDDGSTSISEPTAAPTAPATPRRRTDRREPEPSPEPSSDARSGMRREPEATGRPERRPRATPKPTPRPQRQPQGRSEPPVIRLPGDVKPSLFDAPDDEELLRRNGCLHSEEAVVPRACLFGNLGSRTTIALVGDSHASHWYPALRGVVDDKGWELATYVKVSCPFMDMPVRNLQLKREYRECARFNANVVTQLKRLKPDLVVTALSRWQHPTKDGDESVNAQAAAMARLAAVGPGPQGRPRGRALPGSGRPRLPLEEPQGHPGVRRALVEPRVGRLARPRAAGGQGGRRCVPRLRERHLRGTWHVPRRARRPHHLP